MNVPILKQGLSNQNWLVGVPQKKAPSFWWRIFYWPDAIGCNNVSVHMRSSGIYCPECGQWQSVSGRCRFCGCPFACFVVLEAMKDSRKKGRINGLLDWLGKASLRTRVLVASVMFLSLVTLFAGIVTYQNHAQKQYAHNYVQALYLIKSGMHLNEMICNGTYNAWRGVESSASSEASEIDPQAVADLDAVKGKLKKLMGKMGTPPVECRPAARIFKKIYAHYEKANLIVINSPYSLFEHKAEIAAEQNAFSHEIENLKVNMSASLTEELKKASRKYDLSFIANK